MQLGPRHRELDENGIGLCSVPMWCDGMPAGFCDAPAYGHPTPEGDRMIRREGLHVPALACPAHGGPASRVFRDGDQFCAVWPDFVNLQESLAGFGDTEAAARTALEIASNVPAGNAT